MNVVQSLKIHDVKTLNCTWLGRVDYCRAARLQERMVQRRAAGLIEDQLLILEHPPVITMGRRLCYEDLLTTPQDIQASGIEMVKTDRGGRLTYHGPGQLIGYFICDVHSTDGIRRFVNAVEKSIIDTCTDFGIEAYRDRDYPGVWVKNDKIAAVGFHVTQGITSHGCALNVNNDLDPYRHIVPCGIHDRGVTSLKKATGHHIALGDVINSFLTHIAEVFGCFIDRYGKMELPQHYYSFDSAATKVNADVLVEAGDIPSSKTSM